MAGTITKTVKGRRYIYFEYFEDGKTVQKYCEPEGSSQARVKALEIEYRLLEKRQMIVIKRMASVKKKMERMKAETEDGIGKMSRYGSTAKWSDMEPLLCPLIHHSRITQNRIPIEL